MMVMRCEQLLPLVVNLLAISFATEQTSKIWQDYQAPVAKKVPHYRELYDERFQDDYTWMKNIRNDTDVLRYISDEMAYTSRAFGAWSATTKKLTEELQAIYNSISYVGDAEYLSGFETPFYRYYKKQGPKDNYPVFYRRPLIHSDSAIRLSTAREEVILDLNALAANESYFNLCSMDISPSDNLLAYSIDTNGSELCTLKFKDLITGRRVDAQVTGVGYGLAWSIDSSTIFYTMLDEAKAHRYVYRLQIYAPRSATNPALVYTEPDRTLDISLSTTNDKQWIVIESVGAVTSEVRLLDTTLASIGAPPLLFARKEENVTYHVEHNDGMFYVRTNALGAKNFQILKVRADEIFSARPSGKPFASWEKVIAHDPEHYITSFECFEHHLVVWYTEKSLPKFFVYDLRISRVVFPQNGTDLQAAIGIQSPNFAPVPGSYELPNANRDYNAQKYVFTYSSLVDVPTVMTLNFETFRVTKVMMVKYGVYTPSDYCEQRIWVPNPDENRMIRVPVGFVYKKQAGMTECWQEKPPKPMQLSFNVYGAYGINLGADFDIKNTLLLDRGFIVALGFVRGGAEMGWRWYEDGKYEKKINTARDTIACLRYFSANGYTTARQMSVSSMSAGGLPVGAVANMAPDSVASIVAQVPFVDPLTDMLDPMLPLTTHEWFEWGNPATSRDIYVAMKAYSPYENIKRQAYPNMLVTAGVADSRVPFYEPLKYVAKLRAYKTDQNLLAFIMYDRGHFAVARNDTGDETSTIYTFIIHTLAGPPDDAQSSNSSNESRIYLGKPSSDEVTTTPANTEERHDFVRLNKGERANLWQLLWFFLALVYAVVK